MPDTVPTPPPAPSPAPSGPVPGGGAAAVPPAKPRVYKPTGKVSWLRFLPLAALSFLVALIMALVFLLCENRLHYVLVTPLILSLPVAGMAVLTFRVGKCRNPLLGLLLGLALAVAFYGGYWTLSYTANVLAAPPLERLLVEAESGPGLWGYFVWRCKHSRTSDSHTPDSGHERKPSAANTGFNMFTFGMEFAFLLVLGGVVGRGWTRRVFYEPANRWSTQLELRYRPDDFAAVLRAVSNGDWQALGHLQPMPKPYTNQGAGALYVTLKVEYLPELASQPMFVSLEGFNLGKLPAAREAGAKGFGGISKAFIRQQVVPPAESVWLPRLFPEIRVPVTPLPPAPAAAAGTAATAPAAAPGIPPAGTPMPEPPARPAWSPGFTGLAEVIGLKKRPTPGPDFRAPCVEESRRLLGAAGSMTSLQTTDCSVCVDTGQEGEKLLTRTVLWDLKLQLLVLLCLPLCPLGALGVMGLFGLGDKQPADFSAPPLAWVLFALLGLLFIGSLLLFLFKESISRARLRRAMMRRPGSFLSRQLTTPPHPFRLEDARTFHIAKAVPEDWCLAVCDESAHRILLEGCTHRYIIRGADVVLLRPAPSNTSSAIEMRWRIGARELGVVLTDAAVRHAFAAHFVPSAPLSAATKLAARLAAVLRYAPQAPAGNTGAPP